MEQGAVGNRVGGRVSRRTSSSLRSMSKGSTMPKKERQESPPRSPDDQESVSGKNDSSVNNGPGLYTFEMLSDHITKGRHGKKLYKVSHHN